MRLQEIWINEEKKLLELDQVQLRTNNIPLSMFTIIIATFST